MKELLSRSVSRGDVTVVLVEDNKLAVPAVPRALATSCAAEVKYRDALPSMDVSPDLRYAFAPP
jgi:hypothetical protein